jgi:nitrous-oxide reductase
VVRRPLRRSRVLGLPSGREIKRVPTFNIDCMSGWGITNESKAIITTKADGSLKYKTGDTHHIHGSYTDGTYDGKYFWVNDKIHGRIARIRGDLFECDKITEIPNIQGFHGIFPDKRDPVDQALNHTTRVFCGNEFHIPHPNDGRDLDDPTKYKTRCSLRRCRNHGRALAMPRRWQHGPRRHLLQRPPAAANQYNVEGGAHYEDMMSAEKDACVFFDVARIEQAIKDGKFVTIGDSKVPVVDGTKDANKDPKTALTCYVPVPKNPTASMPAPTANTSSARASSPTATVIDLAKVEEFLDGKLDDINKSIVAEVEIGLGPLHTTYDGRGNAFDALSRQPDRQVEHRLGDQVLRRRQEREIRGRPHRRALPARPHQRRHGRNQGSRRPVPRRGLQVLQGPLPAGGPAAPGKRTTDRHPRRKDEDARRPPVYPEPHDFIIVKREKIKTRQVFNVDDFPLATKDPKDSGVTRNGNKVTVRLVSQAPAYSLREFKIKKGDEVTIIDQPGQGRRPHPRLRDSQVRHQLHRESAGNQVRHLQGRQTGCVLVLLHAFLPRPAPRNAHPHARRKIGDGHRSISEVIGEALAPPF